MENCKEIDFDNNSDGRLRPNGDDADDDSSCSSPFSEIGSDPPAAVSDSAAIDMNRDREERVLQWLHALDVQVVGACRADERLKPMLISNVPCGHAEDLLLAHLNQHFEPSEVGMLARCFCVPLVSLRVGKIEKQGTLFFPTPYRGNLNIMVLPTSDMHLVFVGDDGNTERLLTVRNKLHCPVVSLEEIPADSSGRSFKIKVSDGRDFFFWCSEKSKLLGIELLSKIKGILETKPSISVLSGIDQLRLDCFAIHLHAYLLGCKARENNACAVTSSCTSDSAAATSKRSRHAGLLSNKSHLSYQGILSPRSSSFKEGQSRSISSMRIVGRDKLRRRNDGILSAVDDLVSTQTRPDDASALNNSEHDKSSRSVCHQEPLTFMDASRKLGIPPPVSAACDPLMAPPLFSPHYCWCPQLSSNLDNPPANMDLITSSIESSSLLPLPSIVVASRSSNLFTPPLSFSFSSVPPFDFPALLPDPLVRLPLTSSQQIPTFTPLICDPIVHIPVIDVCSSGQGYLVSAGPVIQNSIPPLMPKLVKPLVSETESMLEKGARETLRLLISGSSTPNSRMLSTCEAPNAIGSLKFSGDVDFLTRSIGPLKLEDEDSGVSLDDSLEVVESLSSTRKKDEEPSRTTGW